MRDEGSLLDPQIPDSPDGCFSLSPPHSPPHQLRKCKWSSSWTFLLFLLMERMFLVPPCHCCGPLPSQTILPWRPHLCPGSLNPHAQSPPDPVVPSESWAIYMAHLMDIPANIIPALQTRLPYSCVPSSKCFLPTPYFSPRHQHLPAAQVFFGSLVQAANKPCSVFLPISHPFPFVLPNLLSYPSPPLPPAPHCSLLFTIQKQPQPS